MNTYTFTFKVIGYKEIEIEADNFEEAKKNALNEICDVDFGYLENIDSELINTY